jgi:hypothetical protein
MSGTQFETIDLRVAVFLGRLNGQVCCLREKLAGATGLEPAASCVTGRRSDLSEAVCANVGRIVGLKDLLREETADA